MVEKKDICAKAALKTEFFPDRTHVAELRAAARELTDAEQRLLARTNKRDAHTADYDAELAELGTKAEQNGGKEKILLPINDKISKAKSKRKNVFIFGAIALCLALFGGIAIGFINLYVGIAALCGFAGIGAVAVVTFIGSQKAKKSATAELCALAEVYKTTPDGLSDKIDESLGELLKMRAYNTENAKLLAELELAEESLECVRDRAYKMLVLTLGEDAEPDTSTLESEASRLSAFLDEYEALKNEENAFLRILDNERNSLARYDEQKLRSEITVSFDTATQEAVDEAERTKSFLLAKKAACESKITLLQNELIALRIKAEDPMPIADRLAQLEEKVKKDRTFYDALILAMTAIEDASASMRGNVTPIISKMASDIISRISGDKYSVLRTNSRLDVMLDNNGFAVNSELLSAGTKDAAYIALRIALIMQIYGKERPPIIFDESLCQLDDKRLSKVMELLSTFCEEGIQVIFFTSHKREAKYCEDGNIGYNLISL
jgi:uncharacterized protein YhaN